MYYSPSAEIEKYLQDVVETYDLNKYAVYGIEVLKAEWLEDQGQWKISLRRENGEIFEDFADFYINGGGILKYVEAPQSALPRKGISVAHKFDCNSTPRWPHIEGLRSFKGPLTHSGRYDESIDLRDKRVLVVGIGSSGTQIVPSILDDVKHIHLVARSKTWITGGIGANWVEPNAKEALGNFYYSEKTKQRFAKDPKTYLRYIKSIDTEMSHRFRMYLNGTPEFYAAINV